MVARTRATRIFGTHSLLGTRTLVLRRRLLDVLDHCVEGQPLSYQGPDEYEDHQSGPPRKSMCPRRRCHGTQKPIKT